MKTKIAPWIKYSIFTVIFFCIFAVFVLPYILPSTCTRTTLKTQIQGTAFDLKSIKFALKTYYDKNAQYPDSLAVLVEKNMLEKGYLKDLWHHHYNYAVFPSKDGKKNQQYTLSSSGSDGIKETKDDLR